MSIALKFSKGRYWLYDHRGVPIITANKFLDTLHIRGLSPHTLRAYGYDLLALFRWLVTINKEHAQLTIEDLLRFIEYQREQGLNAASINRRLVAVQLFCRFCGIAINAAGSPYVSNYYRGRGNDRELGLNQIRASTFRLLRVKAARHLVEPLTLEQVRLFLSTLTRYRDMCIVYLMLFCGLRSHEVLRLRIDDVSFEENHLRIFGKGSKERIIPLPTVAKNSIKKYLALERSPHKNSSPILFVVLQGQRKGSAMTTAGLRTIFRHRRLIKTLCNANAHRWRHTFGADMARAGTSLPVIQRLMGHTDARITLQYINLSMIDIAEEFNHASQQILQRYRK